MFNRAARFRHKMGASSTLESAVGKTASWAVTVFGLLVSILIAAHALGDEPLFSDSVVEQGAIAESSATGGSGQINVDAIEGSDAPIADADAFAFTSGISRAPYPDVDYRQPHRPQFHFTSKRNWLNDPNGMVHDGEKYHLFFQHNPKGTVWGNMTWGHAASRDMVHWKQQEHALLPYRVGRRSGTIFSGTAVVDHNNSLGVQQGAVKTLAAFFTFANEQPSFYQALAYSTDRGETWTYYNDGKAVVPNQGFDSGERDPKVFWHEDSGQWIMALWVQRNPGRVRFFTSTNLTDWQFASDLMRDWAYECMDCVFMPVDGDAEQTKCVLYDASFDYEIGAFDGKAFHAETKPLHAGRGDFYAPQTFYNSPDGRTVQIGWMRGGPNSADVYRVPFNQQMSFPCELTLRTTDDGVRLFCWPVREIESLVKQTHVKRDVELTSGVNLLASIDLLDLVDLSIDFQPGTATGIVFEFRGVKLTYDVAKQALIHTGVNIDGGLQETTTLDKLTPRDGHVRLRLLIDRLSVEAYAFDGERFAAYYYSPEHGSGNQSIRAEGGTAKITRITVRELKSAW